MLAKPTAAHTIPEDVEAVSRDQIALTSSDPIRVAARVAGDEAALAVLILDPLSYDSNRDKLNGRK